MLILGAGVAGLQAAVDLTGAGKRVYLADAAPTIGGLMPCLDRTFPTHDCHMCMIAPPAEDRRGCLRGGVVAERLPNLELLPATELTELQGEAGNFRALLISQPRFIEPELCTACGQCAAVCPEQAVSEYNAGLETRRAAYQPGPQAVPRRYVIDPVKCTRCGLCVPACPVAAIDLNREAISRELAVGAVIVATGSSVFHPGRLSQYYYGQHPNVLTSLAFERLASGTGPTGGRILRPSDQQPPRKIAWLQCIGSRDVKTHSYCSSFCCLATVKEVLITKDQLPAAEATVFFMDLRAAGKGYEPYYQRAAALPGVRFINYRVPELWPAPGDRLRIYYPGPEGHKVAEEFDLVVLAVGFEPADRWRELATRLGLELNAHGYPVTQPWQPVATSRPGVFVCGASQAPKDIPDSVTEGSAAAAAALAVLAPPAQAAVELTRRPQTGGAAGRGLGIVFCGCDAELTSHVDIQALQTYLAGLPEVKTVFPVLADCRPRSLTALAQQLREAGLDRLLVLSGAPASDNPRWQQLLAQAGLNPYLIETINLRTEITAVHPQQPAAALAKAKQLVRQAVARLRHLEPLVPSTFSLPPRALVLGGGVAGMTAALQLARLGITVYLVEKDTELGGLARRLVRTIDGLEVQPWLAQLRAQVEREPGIDVFLGWELLRQQGKVGQLRTTLRHRGSGEERELSHSVMIVATGAQPYQPREYLYGQDPRVFTQLELGQLIRSRPEEVKSWRRVVMIQCIGSRTAANPECSRICCQTAVKHALQLRELQPDLDILVFHRDIRTYGFLEDYYTKARDAKVLFLRFSPAEPPRLSREGEALMIAFRDPLLDRLLSYPVDAVILSEGVVAPAGREMAASLGLPVSAQGFFQEAQPKTKPVEFWRPGYYLCGLAHSPRLLPEVVAQGLAVAGRVAALLLGPQAEVNPIVATVDPGRCVACLACVRICPFQAPQIGMQRKSTIEPTSCRGCGLCVAACPAGAIDLAHSRHQQVAAAIQATLVA